MSPFKMRGLALLSVLIFLLMLTGLNIYMLKANSWELHIAGNSWRKNLIVHTAEQQLTTIATQLLTMMPACQIPATLRQELIAKPLAWWQANACVGDAAIYQYYYVLEVLGNDACAQTSVNSADYYRVTLLILEKEIPSQTRAILQATTIVPHVGMTLCKLVPHKVNAGIQHLQILV